VHTMDFYRFSGEYMQPYVDMFDKYVFHGEKNCLYFQIEDEPKVRGMRIDLDGLTCMTYVLAGRIQCTLSRTEDASKWNKQQVSMLCADDWYSYTGIVKVGDPKDVSYFHLYDRKKEYGKLGLNSVSGEIREAKDLIVDFTWSWVNEESTAGLLVPDVEVGLGV
jgi:hypothetical protein